MTHAASVLVARELCFMLGTGLLAPALEHSHPSLTVQRKNTTWLSRHSPSSHTADGANRLVHASRGRVTSAEMPCGGFLLRLADMA
ncbi:uncharacterized protein B0I36DRAFT_317913 [Microdochium trichocladiopsis]|uniref:Secreted protein n=1 Tax=Microdochium trichocladiopsis TaxID=1682393 RepID=A0A9P8YE24_9PEZI|nr:uncharacterized protein B0I36DRAFT_317913 [Microdochium trichocladiopsis]KAH7035232.1 hypothetical protein B0I36DRAFT_317913 [Microdochium trichocladiopsis]